MNISSTAERMIRNHGRTFIAKGKSFTAILNTKLSVLQVIGTTIKLGDLIFDTDSNHNYLAADEYNDGMFRCLNVIECHLSADIHRVDGTKDAFGRVNNTEQVLENVPTIVTDSGQLLFPVTATVQKNDLVHIVEIDETWRITGISHIDYAGLIECAAVKQLPTP